MQTKCRFAQLQTPHNNKNSKTYQKAGQTPQPAGMCRKSKTNKPRSNLLFPSNCTLLRGPPFKLEKQLKVDLYINVKRGDGGMDFIFWTSFEMAEETIF